MFEGIYFIKARELANQFRLNEVSDLQALRNFMAFVILFATGYEVPIYFEYDWVESEAPFLTFYIVSVVHYIGVMKAYEVNNKGGGQDFFKKFAALSFPVSMQVSIIFLAVIIPSLIGMYALEQDVEAFGAGFFTFGIEVAVWLYVLGFYYLMVKNMEVAGNSEETPELKQGL